MTATTAFPVATTVAQGMFADPSAAGLVQGHAEPDPSVYFALQGGVLSTSETLPMWGGVAVYADVPGGSGAPNSYLGSVIGRATTVTGGSAPIAGFSVFDQAYGMVQSPQSPVQMAGSGQQVAWYPLGSRARIAVACDPGLVSLRGTPLGSSVAWDFVNQQLIPYTGNVTISSGTYNSTTGAVALTLATNPGLSAGDSFTLSGLTGTGGYASLDGTWTATAGTSGTTVNFTGPTGLGATTITGGTLATGAAIPVSVLDIVPSTSMTVVYDAASNTASWNYAGACALIRI